MHRNEDDYEENTEMYGMAADVIYYACGNAICRRAGSYKA